MTPVPGGASQAEAAPRGTNVRTEAHRPSRNRSTRHRCLCGGEVHNATCTTTQAAATGKSTRNARLRSPFDGGLPCPDPRRQAVHANADGVGGSGLAPRQMQTLHRASPASARPQTAALSRAHDPGHVPMYLRPTWLEELARCQGLSKRCCAEGWSREARYRSEFIA